jgi:F0F1-type ATP synthase membrane subunit b/b'
MTDFRDILHDEVDAIESLKERARELVQQAIEKVLPDAVDKNDIPTALALVADHVEEGLTDLTTEALQLGATFHSKRSA